MSEERPTNDRRLRLAACAVAVATAVGGTSLLSAGDTQAVEQIERYCTTSWRNAGIDRQDWPDCTQQALVELLERVSLTDAIEDTDSDARRELNRTVWRTVQRWRRSPRHLHYDDAAATKCDPNRSQPNDDAWDEVMSIARQQLSERQNRILAMIRDGWRVSEIADELAMSPARVSDEKYKAICKLREHLGVGSRE